MNTPAKNTAVPTMEISTTGVSTKDKVTETTAQTQTETNDTDIQETLVKETDDYVADIPDEELEHLAAMEVFPYLPPATSGSSVSIDIDKASTTAQPSAPSSSRAASQMTIHLTVTTDHPPAPPNTRSASPSVNDTSVHQPLPNPFPHFRRSSSIQSMTIESNERGGVTYRIVLVLSRIGAWLKRKILRRRATTPASVATTYARHQSAMQRRNHLIEYES